MTMQERIKAHADIAAEDERKQEAWKNAILPRSFYTIEYRDPPGAWKIGSSRVERRYHARIINAIYRSAGFETRIRKETRMVQPNLR